MFEKKILYNTVSRIREMYQEILILANSKSHCACSAEGVMKNSKSVYRANGRGNIWSTFSNCIMFLSFFRIRMI